MKVSISRTMLVLLALCSLFATHANAFDPLIGTWKVVDQRSNSYVADIVIRKNSKTQQYSAVIVKMYPLAKEAAPTLCSKCTGALKDQPIIGMQVLSGLKAASSNEGFEQGIWLNPYDGYTYRLNAQLSKTGKLLNISMKSTNSPNARNMTWIRL